MQMKDCGSCTDIIGRRCLEDHLRRHQFPWSHTCPVCKENWLSTAHRGKEDVVDKIKVVRDSLEKSIEAWDMVENAKDMKPISRAVKKGKGAIESAKEALESMARMLG